MVIRAIVNNLTFKNNFMLWHLFKLIWNKKKHNFLMITEIFVSFIVIFALFTMMVFYYQNYKQPMGFDYDNVWAVNLIILKI